MSSERRESLSILVSWNPLVSYYSYSISIIDEHSMKTRFNTVTDSVGKVPGGRFRIQLDPVHDTT